jgi:hypothetical protein
VGGLGEEIRGGGRHHHGVRALGDRDVLHRLAALGIEEIGEHRAPRQRTPGEIADEALRVGRAHHRDRRAEPGELA